MSVKKGKGRAQKPARQQPGKIQLPDAPAPLAGDVSGTATVSGQLTEAVAVEPLTHHMKSDGTIVELTEDEKKKLSEEGPK